MNVLAENGKDSIPEQIKDFNIEAPYSDIIICSTPKVFGNLRIDFLEKDKKNYHTF